MLFQELCKLEIEWNDEIPDNLRQKFCSIISTLKDIENIEIKRFILETEYNEPIIKIELHGFSDASSPAYDAAIYSKGFTKSRKVVTRLITSRSRVAPMKSSTIPRLELLGNLLLARLMKSVENALEDKLKITEKYFWTDSQVTLSWILADKKEFKVLVENGIREIRQISNKNDWHQQKIIQQIF